jgi:hypothetical protein
LREKIHDDDVVLLRQQCQVQKMEQQLAQMLQAQEEQMQQQQHEPQQQPAQTRPIHLSNYAQLCHAQDEQKQQQQQHLRTPDEWHLLVPPDQQTYPPAHFEHIRGDAVGVLNQPATREMLHAQDEQMQQQQQHEPQQQPAQTRPQPIIGARVPPRETLTWTHADGSTSVSEYTIGDPVQTGHRIEQRQPRAPQPSSSVCSPSLAHAAASSDAATRVTPASSDAATRVTPASSDAATREPTWVRSPLSRLWVSKAHSGSR